MNALTNCGGTECIKRRRIESIRKTAATQLACAPSVPLPSASCMRGKSQPLPDVDEDPSRKVVDAAHEVLP